MFLLWIAGYFLFSIWIPKGRELSITGFVVGFVHAEERVTRVRKVGMRDSITMGFAVTLSGDEFDQVQGSSSRFCGGSFGMNLMNARL